MAMAVLGQAGHVGLAHGPWGPADSAWVKLTLCTKSIASFIFASRNFRILYNLVKCISFDLVIRKMRMIYQNAQKNMLYLLESISCIVNQL
jgi:hypothetical protein